MTEGVAAEGSGVYPLLEYAEVCCSGEAVMGWRGAGRLSALDSNSPKISSSHFLFIIFLWQIFLLIWYLWF